MTKKEIYDFADSCVVALGELVGEKKREGLAKGFAEDEIRKIWITTFDILSQKKKISRQLMSQNLRRK